MPFSNCPNASANDLPLVAQALSPANLISSQLLRERLKRCSNRPRGRFQMMRSIFAILLSGLLVVSAQPPQTQQAAPAAPPAAPKGVIKFGATTQLVVVDVTVKDKSGSPIRGLKPADFNITEDGKRSEER